MVYVPIGDPPLFAGAVHAMIAEALPAEATPPVGEPGTVNACGITTGVGAENGLQAVALQACTTNSTGVPLVKPVTTAELGTRPFVPAVTVTSGTKVDAPPASSVRTT